MRTRIAFSTRERHAQVARVGARLPVCADPEGQQKVAVNTRALEGG